MCLQTPNSKGWMVLPKKILKAVPPYGWEGLASLLGRFSANERNKRIANLVWPTSENRVARFEFSRLNSFVRFAGERAPAVHKRSPISRIGGCRVACVRGCVCVCMWVCVCRFWRYFLKLEGRVNEPARSFAFRVTDSSITRGWIRFPSIFDGESPRDRLSTTLSRETRPRLSFVLRLPWSFDRLPPLNMYFRYGSFTEITRGYPGSAKFQRRWILGKTVQRKNQGGGSCVIFSSLLRYFFFFFRFNIHIYLRAVLPGDTPL